MPCSPDMIGLPSRSSVSTPSAFIATSAMPEVAPYTSRAPHSPYRLGERAGRASESVHRASSARSAVRAPRRWLIRPASGMARDAPIAGKASARPSWPALIWAWSWIQGTRVAKLPVTEPCTRKTAATDQRAWRSRAGEKGCSDGFSGGAAGGGTGSGTPVPSMSGKLSGTLPDNKENSPAGTAATAATPAPGGLEGSGHG